MTDTTHTTLTTPFPSPNSQPPPPSRRRHVLDLDDFTRIELDEIFETAASMKEVLGRSIKQVPILRGKTVATLFLAERTRTRLAFELAARALSANVVSLAPEEPLLDTARTLHALGVDILVARHAEAGAPYLLARHFAGAVINGGDSYHAHPTSALRDLFTIHEKLGLLDQLKVVIVGDVLHSGIARSHIWGLGTLGARVTLCAPHTLLGPEAFWRATWPRLTISTDLDECLSGADVVVSLPLASQRVAAGLLPSAREYGRFFGISAERLQRAAPHCLLLHHGPLGEGVELMPEVLAIARPLIDEQTTNGVAVAMALLYRLAAE